MFQSGFGRTCADAQELRKFLEKLLSTATIPQATELCLQEIEELDVCFSPERRFYAKERRERPPRRYDKWRAS